MCLSHNRPGPASAASGSCLDRMKSSFSAVMPGRLSARSRCSCSPAETTITTSTSFSRPVSKSSGMSRSAISAPAAAACARNCACISLHQRMHGRFDPRQKRRMCLNQCCQFPPVDAPLDDGRRSNRTRWQPPHRRPLHKAHGPRRRCRRPECPVQQTSSPSRSCPSQWSLSAQRRSWTIIRIDIPGDQRVKLRRDLWRDPEPQRKTPHCLVKKHAQAFDDNVAPSAPHPGAALCGAAYRRCQTRRPTVKAAQDRGRCQAALSCRVRSC